MNTVVKILTDDLGEKRDKHLHHWHYVVYKGGPQTLCQGEYFGEGESGCEFVVKKVKRGGITCPDCLSEIKGYKSVKL